MTAAPESNPCFSLELALRIDSAGRKRLDRDFDFGRQLVNATLGIALGRRTQMRQTPEWKAACAMPKGKERTKAFSELSKRFGIASAYDFEKILQAHANASGRAKQLHSDIKQVLADNLWKSGRTGFLKAKVVRASKALRAVCILFAERRTQPVSAGSRTNNVFGMPASSIGYTFLQRMSTPEKPCVIRRIRRSGAR